MNKTYIGHVSISTDFKCLYSYEQTMVKFIKTNVAMKRIKEKEVHY